jgi:uncharacterized membrane protein YhaH (DUF805 family)
MVADSGVVEWVPSLRDLLRGLFWLALSVGLLWIHTARWLTDGPLGRRVREETTRRFVLEIPHGLAGSIGWAGVPVWGFLTAVMVLGLAGVEPTRATHAAAAGVAALLTLLVWHSGKRHRWALLALPAPERERRWMPTPTEAAPAGWYSDPQDADLLRFWDGGAWTSSRVLGVPLPWPGEPSDLHGSTLDGFGALKSGFRNAFVYRGRASRSAFWWFQLAAGLPWMVLAVLSIWAINSPASPSAVAAQYPFSTWLLAAASLLALIVYLVPTIALTVRRLHDINQSGWWALVSFFPGGSLALLVLTVLPGTPGPNRFDRPDGRPGAIARHSTAATT